MRTREIGKTEYLLIDLDDTIFDFKAAERSAFFAAMRGLGLKPTSAWASRYSAINDEMWKGLERGELTREQVKVGRYERLFAELGIAASAMDARLRYERELSRECPLMPGAERFLERASKNLKLYLITNGTASVQNGRLDRAGIRKYFAGIFISETIGFTKPDRRFFEAVTSSVEGFEPSRALVAGDSYTSDVRGGINAGLATCLVSGEVPPGCRPPDYAVKDLAELETLLFGARR